MSWKKIRHSCGNIAYDMRNGRKSELEQSPLSWYGELCGEIETALKAGNFKKEVRK